MAVSTSPAAATISGPDVPTARITGLLYLALAIVGGVGFMIVRPQLFDPSDAAATLANLQTRASLARAGIALALLLVAFQTLAALWFARLFRPVHAFAATAIGVFGTMNAIAVLSSAALIASALEVAGSTLGQGSSQLLYVISGNFWGVGQLFFGLWLIPMGIAVLRSHWAPRLLAWILIVGGVGYLISAFGGYLLPAAPAALEMILALPATVGEFWMIGWLLTRRRRGRPERT